MYYSVKQQEEAIRKAEFYNEERKRLNIQFANEKRVIQKKKNSKRF
jgi:hypothetical protein